MQISKNTVKNIKQIDINIGLVSCLAQNDTTDWETVFRKAEEALDISKEGGKNRCHHLDF